MFSAIAVKSQVSGDYRSVLSGNWNTLATWQRYNGTTWATPTNVSPQGYPGQFVSNANVLIQPANAVSINVSIPNALASLTVGTTTTSATLSFNLNSAITLNVTGDVAVNYGTFNITNAASSKTHLLNIGGNLTVAIGSTFNLDNASDDYSTVTFNTATTQAITNNGTTRFYNLTINKSAAANTVTSTGNSFVVNNNLTLTTGNLILQAVNADYGVTNDVTISANGTLSHNVDYSSTGFDLTTGGSFLCDGIYNYNSNALVVMTGSAKNIRTGTNASSGFSNLTLSNGNITANGALKINNAFSVALTSGSIFSTGSQVVNANGGISISGGAMAIAGGTTTIINKLYAGTGAGNGTLNITGGTTNIDDVYLGNVTRTGTLTQSTGTLNISGNVTIATGSSWTCTSAPTASIAGNWTNNGTFTRSTGTINFNGIAPQTVAGTVATTFYNLTDNNTSAGGLLLDANATVANNLVLNSSSNGKIFTGSNTLFCTKTSAAITGYSSTRYIAGNLNLFFPVSTTTTLLYPVGSETVYAPATITSRTLTTALTLTVATSTGTASNEDNPVTNASGIDPTKKCENYWTLTKVGSGTFTSFDALFDFTNCTNNGTVANYKLRNFSTAWGNIASPVLTATSIKGNTLTAFGEFATGEQRAAPAVVTNPSNQNLCSGSATFTSSSSASPTSTIQWQRSTGSGFVNITAGLDATAVYSGFTSNSLVISGGTGTLNGYLYRAIFTNINGSTNSNSAVLSYTATTIAYPSASLCSNNLTASVTRTGVAGGTYSAAGGLVIDATSGMIDLVASTPGSYTVTYSYTGVCGPSAATVNISVNTSPVITISANFCIGNGYVQLTSTAGSSYLWSTGVTTQSMSVNTAGNFTVITTDANGCTGSDTYNTAPELVVNGDFEAGNTGFTTLYTYTSAANGLYPEGNYGVGNNANYYHSNFYGIDHTSGSGNCMIINGAPTTRNVWQQTITVVPNTLYYFSAYAVSVNNVSPYAQLQFAVNGSAVGSIANLIAGASSNAGPFNWIRFYGTWNSGSTTTAIINVVDLQTAAGGNDFALDDISFSTLSPVTFGVAATGTSPVCVGDAINLGATLTGGNAPFIYSWTGPNSFTSGIQNPVITSAVSANAGTYSIGVTDRYGCPVTATKAIVVNPLPTNKTISSTSATVCSGSSGTIQVASSDIGINYQLRNNAGNVLIGTPVAGNGSTINLSTGALTVNTTFNVLAINSTTSCSVQMAGTTTITINPLPNDIAPVAQTATFCAGNSTNIQIANSQSGVKYQLRDNSNNALVGSTVSGNNGTISLPTGILTTTTTFNVVATFNSTSCLRQMTSTVTITIKPLPTDITPTAQSASICTSSSTNIQIAASQSGVTYQLRENTLNTNVGTAVTGNGGTISLPTGTLVASTTYNVLATNTTTTCALQMSSTVTVTVNPVIANNNIGTAQTICSGATPTALTGSVPTGGSGTYVYLWESSTASSGGPYATASGTSNTQGYSPGAVTQNTWYRRTVTSGGCSNITAGIQITTNPLPTDIAPVAQAASICTSTSTNIQIASSQTGVNYQLRNNAGNVSVGAVVAGTGGSIDLPTGTLTSTTTFNVVATNTSTTCLRQMTSTVTVTVNPVIANNTISAAQSICTGSAPAAFAGTLPTGGSSTYAYLWESSTTSAVAGFGTATGTATGQNYTAGVLTQNTWYRRTVTSGGCGSTSAAIQVSMVALPADIAPAAQASPICSGSSTNIQIATSEVGVNYQLRNNATGVNIGAAVAGSGAVINLPTGTLTTSTTFNVVANNPSTTCSRQMTSTAAVTVTPSIANNTAGTAQAICPGTAPSVLSGGLPTGGTGTYLYLWETSTTSAVAGFATAAGTSNGQNYTPATPTQTTWYRRTVTSGTCSNTSAAVQITVNTLPTDITPAAQAASICTSTSTNIQITGSQTGVNYQLRNNAGNAAILTAVAGTGGVISLPTGALTSSTTFNVLATDATTGCSRQMTNTVLVTVNPVIASNTLGSTAAICSGGSITVTGSLPTGGSGSYSYSWESSTTSASSGFSSVACACTSQNYPASNLTQNTWFRRTVSSGGCSSTSAAILVTVNPAGQWVGGSSGNWNVAGNWCGGIPTSSTNVVIPSGSVISIQSTNAVANSVNIAAGGSLVMTGAYNLTITANGSFANNGTFTASASTGSVIFNGDGTISGTTIFQNIDTKGALNFGTTSTINGVFTLQTGGSVTGNSPTYVCPSSTLQYNTGTVFTRGLEWTTTASGAGYPSNVIVQNNTTINFPAVGQGYVCNDLTIQSGGSLMQNYSGGSASLSIGRNVVISGILALGGSTGGDINVGGSWTRNAGATFTSNDRKVTFDGPSNFSGRGTAAATITAPASSLKNNEGGFGGESFAHIWINKTNTTDSVILASNITVTRELGLTKGTFSLRNSDVTLVSNSTRTADIAPISAPANVAIRYAGTGRFNIQRYVQNPTAVRSWRLLTAPVQSASAPTINEAWQYAAVNPDKTQPNGSGGIYNPWPGYGIHISGPGGTYNLANGFDQGTNAPSILFAGAGVTTWTNPSSTTATKVTDQPGWMLFVRGDRGFVIGNQYTPSQNVTLETRGVVNTGDIVKAVSAGKQVIGNPYPSAISFKDVNVSGTLGRNSNYYRWDPKMFTSYTQPGKWVSFTGLGNSFIATTSASAYDANGTIESGEAIVIEPGAAGNITFHESDKLALSSSLVGIANRPLNNYAILRSDVYAGNGSNYTLTDAVVNIFEAGFDNKVTGEDVKKIVTFNTKESFSIERDSTKLAIEKRRPVNESDTIFYSMSKFNMLPYQVRFTPTGFDAAVSAFLEDTYLHTTTPVSLQVPAAVDFEITADPASASASRFRLVLKQAGVLPVTFTGVKAWKDKDAIAVEWQVQNELNIQHYEMEKSTNGVDFTTIATVPAKGNYAGNRIYSQPDNQPASGDNFYRIRSVANDGAKHLSKVVKVNTAVVANIKLLSNPVTDGAVKLHLGNAAPGKYIFRLLNAAGQTIAIKEVRHVSGDLLVKLEARQKLAAGKYTVEVVQPGSTSSVSVLYQ